MAYPNFDVRFNSPKEKQMGQADQPGKGLSDRQRKALHQIVKDVRFEAEVAAIKHAPSPTPHHAHSILREEFEELWDHVKADTGRTTEARKEAIQVAAMAVRYILDLIDAPEADK